MGLSCGERIVRCLLGQSVDRVPFGIGLGWAPWGQTLDRWRRESDNPELDVSKDLGFEPAWASPSLEYGLWPHFQRLELDRSAEYVVFRDHRGITMRNRRDGGSMPEFLEHPVRTEDDWRRLRDERLDPDAPGRVPQDWAAFGRRLEQTGEAVVVGAFPWGVFGTVRDLLGAEATLLAFYDQPALIAEMMEHLTTLWISLYERVAERVPIARIHLWEDMAGRQGLLISPAMVEQFMMPCYDRIADFARRHRVGLISVDSDGDVDGLLPVMVRHGVNVFEPFEVAAGCEVEAVRRAYPRLGIMGGLDKRDLARGREAIDTQVEKARRMIRQGGYLPMFDHLIPPDVPWANFRCAAEKIRQLCRGG